jgi:hypothetical protein
MKAPRAANALRYTLERKLAPHVDARWAEAFVIELRLIGVHGSRIGDALAEVDSHCGESGLPAAEVFGDPVEYAHNLGQPADDGGPRDILKVLGPTLIQVVGMTVLSWSFADARRGQPWQLTLGHLAIAALLATELAALVLAAERILRGIVHHPILSWFIFMANLGLMVLLLLVLDTNLARLSAAWGATAGGTMLAAGLVWFLFMKRTGRWFEDPLVGPLNAESPPGGAAAGGQRLAAFMDGALPWNIPIFTALILAAEWWLT